MNLIELLAEETRRAGYPEETIEGAHQHTIQLVGQSKRSKEVLNRDLPEELEKDIREYVRYILSNIHKPEVREKVRKDRDRIIERN